MEYYHQDHLGSTRLKTNSTGGVVYDTNYQPFGPAHGESGSEEFKYAGKREDPSGFYYFGARYYDPETGSFITEDPIMGSLDDPQGLNRYVYCRNNPLKNIDRDGKIVIPAWLATGVLYGTINLSFYVAENWGNLNLRKGVAAFSGGFVEGSLLGYLGPSMESAKLLEKVITLALTNTAGTTTELFMQSDPYNYDNDLSTVTGSVTEFGVEVGMEISDEILEYGYVEITTGNPLVDEIVSEAIPEFTRVVVKEMSKDYWWCEFNWFSSNYNLEAWDDLESQREL